MKCFLISLLLLISGTAASAQVTTIKDSTAVKDTVVIKGTISGKVTTEEGLPIVDAEVYVYNIDDIIASATTDSAGNYLTNRMLIGTYRVWVKSRGYIRKSIDGVEVKARQDTKLDIKLSPFKYETGKVDSLRPDAVRITAMPASGR